MLRSRFLQVLLLGMLVLTFSGCAALQTVSENVFLMSDEEEAKLGPQLATEIEKQYKVYKGDPQASAYIESLGQRLVKAAPPSKQKFTFQLVESDEVNAFAIPGGYCYVQTGLLREADNESQLAAVMAHEIGHVVQRHGAKQLSSSQFYSGLSQALLGKDANQLASLAAGIAQSGVLLQHGRQDELQADAVSVAALPRAGLDPNGLVEFFQKLAGASQQSPGRYQQMFSTLLSSHPLSSERIAQAKARIQAVVGSGSNLADDSTTFQQIKKRFPPKPAQSAK